MMPRREIHEDYFASSWAEDPVHLCPRLGLLLSLLAWCLLLAVVWFTL